MMLSPKQNYLIHAEMVMNDMKLSFWVASTQNGLGLPLDKFQCKGTVMMPDIVLKISKNWSMKSTHRLQIFSYELI